MEPSQLFPNLIEWLSTFHGCCHISSPEDVNDGIIIAKVLHQIEPLWFDSGWMEKINMDVGDNWRLKVRNLKKVSQAINDYFSDGLEFSVGLLKQPDLNKLAEHGDVEEAARLLQLVLGVAVNCSRKQEYIEAIQMLESSVQTALMAAIQELMSASSRSSTAGAAGDSLSVSSLLVNRAEQEQIVSELTQIREDRDALQQRCFELSRQLELLHNEKLAAHHENQHLQHRLRESARDGRTPAAVVVGSSDSTAQLDDSSSVDVGSGTGGAVLTSGGDRYKQLRVKLDAAEDEIYRLESSRDEFKNKCDLLSRELKDTQSKNEELQALAEEARTLRDELDILRETSSKVSQYESTLGTYKKRLQEMGDLRRQMTVLENKNTEYMQLNMELEEEVKKSGGYRPQLDIYKKQVAELHEQLAAETKKMDRAEFEVRKLNDKLTSVQCERDRVLEDRDRLKEAVDELRLTQLQQSSDAPGHGGPNSQLSGLDTLHQIPADVRERLMRLQHENSVLRARCGDASQLSSGGQEQAYRALLDDVKQREASQQAENRSAAGAAARRQRPAHRPHLLVLGVTDSDDLDYDQDERLDDHDDRLHRHGGLQSCSLCCCSCVQQAFSSMAACRSARAATLPPHGPLCRTESLRNPPVSRHRSLCRASSLGRASGARRQLLALSGGCSTRESSLGRPYWSALEDNDHTDHGREFDEDDEVDLEHVDSGPHSLQPFVEGYDGQRKRRVRRVLSDTAAVKSAVRVQEGVVQTPQSPSAAYTAAYLCSLQSDGAVSLATVDSASDSLSVASSSVHSGSGRHGSYYQQQQRYTSASGGGRLKQERWPAPRRSLRGYVARPRQPSSLDSGVWSPPVSAAANHDDSSLHTEPLEHYLEVEGGVGTTVEVLVGLDAGEAAFRCRSARAPVMHQEPPTTRQQSMSRECEQSDPLLCAGSTSAAVVPSVKEQENDSDGPTGSSFRCWKSSRSRKTQRSKQSRSSAAMSAVGATLSLCAP